MVDLIVTETFYHKTFKVFINQNLIGREA